jgi:tetratricopeptide (TPR) repeat protein
MRRTLLVVALLTASLLCHAASSRAQETHTHQHDRSEKLGRVNFVVSCNPQAQRQFNRAVAWLHSFEYEEAEKAFTEVTVTDPRCGMGYWGIAMSNYHPIWAPPSAAELQKGSSAIEKAKAAGARTQRERDYIAAIEVFYKDPSNLNGKLDHRTRTFAYSDAMKQLYRRHPSDREAGVFYALTLIATGMMSNDKTYAREKEGAQILNRVLAREPRHPGVAHYIIHSYDYPALAQLALPAARSYAKIAPASAHAQHMPSHIFTRLGLWPEAIRSNLDAKAAAKAHAVRNRMPGAWDEQLHAMDYLAYAYLQSAQDKHARGLLDELNKIQRVDPPNFKVAYAFTAIPARYALERRRWADAAKLPLPQADTETVTTGTAGVSPAPEGTSLSPATGSAATSPATISLKSFPWQRFPWAVAQIHFARAIGAARTGDTASARQDVEKLAAIQQTLVVAKGDYDWAKQVDIERQVASAWLAHAEGKREESLRLMRAAADLDDATDKHPVTPGAILPAREQLGELLLELKQPVAALQEFETSLLSAPNRFNGLYGAARAARLAADQNNLAADQKSAKTDYDKLAKTYYGKLVALARDADSIRPEIEEAKSFLAGADLKDSASMNRDR